MKERYILAINPGSTSTKFALFRESDPIFEENIKHRLTDIEKYKRIAEQFDMRKKLILDRLSDLKVDLSSIKAVVGRGGFLKPIESGIYSVNENMRRDLLGGLRGEHASNLGGLIAYSIASEIPGARAFIVDPVVVDEFDDVARISGHPEFTRKSVFHALNQKAVARLYAGSVGRNYEDMNLIVAHMGGGTTVGAHRKGRVVDVNNGLNGDGPLSPERSGTLPTGQVVELCFSGKYTRDEVMKMLTGRGGMVAYMGTNDFREISRMAEGGDKKALMVCRAAAYQTGKEIGAMAAVLHGQVDAIILTGGMAFQKSHTDYITEMVKSIARVIVIPGEDELKALAYNGLLALNGEIEIKEYV